MSDRSYFGLQFIVFALVSASFTNIYVTQPVLPVLQDEFSVDTVLVSFSVSAAMFDIVISNLPFGFLADRLPIHLIIFTGGILVAVGGWFGITGSGLAYEQGGWSALLFISVLLLIIPLSAGINECKNSNRRTSAFTGRS